MTPAPFRGEPWRDLFASVRARPGRTAVSMGGIFAGTAVLLAMLAIGGGLRARANRLVRDFGADTLAIAATGRAGFRSGDPEILRASLDGAVVTGVRTISAGAAGGVPGAALRAVDPDWIRARPVRLLAGRFLDASDCLRREPYAVADAVLCRAAGVGLGSLVRAGRRLYTVCGIIEGGGRDGAGSDAGPVLLVPRSPDETPDTIFIRATGAGGLGAARTAAARVLAGAGRLPDRLAWVTPDLLVRETNRLRRIIGAAAGTIALLCLASGLATLASLMLVSVRERYVEIGLRRALGATPADVALAFVGEGILIAGGAAALAVGAGAALLARWPDRWPVPVAIDAAVLAIPLASALALGALASAAAAWRAARLNPAEALHAE